MENCPKIITGVENQILGIAIDNFDKTLSVPRNTLDVHFGINSKSLHQRSACLAVHLLLMQKARFETLFLRLIRTQTYRIFLLLYIWFAVKHSFSYWYQFFRVKSNSHNAHVWLILWFSVYRCHRNIDFPKNHMVPNFNLCLVTSVNFTSVWDWEIC